MAEITAVEREAIAAYPQVTQLVECGWLFQPVHYEKNRALLAGARLWPNSWWDAILITGPGWACARRRDPGGRQSWVLERGLRTVITSLLTLPPPAVTSAG